jgi:hypothetical protein
MRELAIFARCVGTGALLTVVWMEATWSVALCLTLLAIESEVVGWMLRRHGDLIRGEDVVRRSLSRIMRETQERGER